MNNGLFSAALRQGTREGPTLEASAILSSISSRTQLAHQWVDNVGKRDVAVGSLGCVDKFCRVICPISVVCRSLRPSVCPSVSLSKPVVAVVFRLVFLWSADQSCAFLTGGWFQLEASVLPLRSAKQTTTIQMKGCYSTVSPMSATRNQQLLNREEQS